MGAFDVHVNPAFLEDVAILPYCKVTPAGMCWKVTAIKSVMQQLFNDLHACTDESEIDGIMYAPANAAVLKACRYGVPRWHRIFVDQAIGLREALRSGTEFTFGFPDAV